MEIREASEKEISEIIDVLKASLGETSSYKTEEVWRFKHIDNPFGKSLVLLAVENGRIVGVRAFMRWKWQIGEKIYSAFRAVDTATHPDFQGKGIFKKLTLKALEIAGESGDHFVFNTPNSNSKPGYLKMGWEEVKKLNISIKLVNPVYWNSSKTPASYPSTQKESINHELVKNYNSLLKNESEKIFTPKSIEYLKWRYFDNPIQSYRILSTKDFFIAGYIKKRNKIKEFRIAELIFTSQSNIKDIVASLNEIAKSYGAQIITFNSFEKKLGLSISGNFGPVLTFKNINLVQSEHSKLLKLESWQYVLGDLELF